MNFFDHKDLGKSPPAVMSTSRETPCIYISVLQAVRTVGEI